MTQEDKELLLRDVCCRLPYGIMCKASIPDLKTDTPPEEVVLRLTSGMLNYIWIEYRNLRPYLRPMSSMTEEEFKEYRMLNDLITINGALIIDVTQIDWFNAHHFDYRGLIEKGLALEALEDMYNIK